MSHIASCLGNLPSLRPRSSASSFNDPLWNKVWYLFKFDDAAGTTDPQDDSIYAHGMHWANPGASQTITAAAGKFGGNAFVQDSTATNGAWIERSITATWINSTWTMEGYFKFDSVAATDYTLFSRWAQNALGASESFIFSVDITSSELRLDISNDGNGIDESVAGTFAPSTGVWYHLVCQKTGSTIDLAVDGTNVASASLSGSIADMLAGSMQDGIFLGGRADNLFPFHGKIDSARITIADRYQSFPFTAGAVDRHGMTASGEFLNTDRGGPLLPLGAEVDPYFRYVDILIDFDSATGVGPNDGVWNHAHKGTLVQPTDSDTVSNRPQWESAANGRSTLVKKHGAASGDFTQSGNVANRLRIEDRWWIQDEPFCMEGWVYFNNILGPASETPLNHTMACQWIGTGAIQWAWWTNGTNLVWSYSTDGSSWTSVYSDTISIPGQQWVHFATTRDSSGVVTHYYNGDNVGSDSGHGGFVSTVRDQGTLGDQDNSFLNKLRGYLDDYRYTRGHVRYTGNFTPPGPLPRSQYSNERPQTLL